ncbi:MAG: DUF3566 domain-containing protein [Acidimicrobiia bacterium]|nr:DUF3566 domain-containing protein [Acidimicrobiia bacterium]
MASSRTESVPIGRDPIEGVPPDDDEPLPHRRSGSARRPARVVAPASTDGDGAAGDVPSTATRVAPSPGTAPEGQVVARRRVHIVRHISPWSVFKVGLLWYLCLWVVVMVASVVLWRVGEETGLLANAQNFWAEATGQESVEWDGEAIFRVAAIAGGIFTAAAAAFTVLGVVLFNGLCDLTGGIRLRILEVVPTQKDESTDAGGRARGRFRRRR